MKKLRRIDQEEVDSEGSWALSYGDMVTLLLAFFVLFFSVDHVKEYKEKLEDAVFQVLTQSAEVQDKRQPASMAPYLVEKDPTIQKWPGKVHKVGSRILIEFPQISFFRSGQTELTKEGREALKNFLTNYMPYAGQHILGLNAYTDQRAVRADVHRYKDNLELSALRSIATMRYLQKEGLPLDRMILGGYGEMKLTEDFIRKLPENHSQATIMDFSRTVVIVIRPDQEVAL